MSPWRGRVNAEVYDRFVRDHQVYRRLNDRIAELADLREARRVLDLACGTGATTMACLPHMAAQAQLMGVDASEDMIEVARANVGDRRVEFRVGPASSVDRIVEGPFDRAVCNAALWQFSSPRAVLDGVRAVLGPGARFVFNVPAERMDGERAPLHPFQIALARAIEERMGRPFPTSPATLRTDRVLDTLRETGFHPDDPSRLRYRGRQAELMELMAIPAMLSPLAPELSEELLQEAWEQARARSDPDESVEVEWIYFVARRR